MVKTAVTTRSYANTRDGANLAEAVFTPDAIRRRGIRKVRVLRTEGDARGCEAQPLVAPNVVTGGAVPRVVGRTRDLVVLATMANRVYAYDAADGMAAWSMDLGHPITGTRAIDAYLINDHWGVLSTPVLDLPRGLVYLVAWQSPDGTAAAAKFKFYALSLATGSVAWFLDLSGATYDPGHGLPVQRFSAAARKQRSSLAYDDKRGLVYIPFGTIAETSKTAQGWVIAVDVAGHAIKGSWTSTARGSGAGIWMAGQGPAIDADGYVYVMTGNGDFDGVTDFGESFVKLTWADNEMKLVAEDWWSPFSDAGREGDDPARPPRPRQMLGRPNSVMPDMEMGAPAVEPSGEVVDVDDDTPTNVRNVARIANGGYSDMDLGSGGVSLNPDLGLVQGGGKDGVMYAMPKDDMGKTMPADFRAPAKNYAKLAFPAIFATYPGFGYDPMPSDFTKLNYLFGNKTRHIHSTPVTYRSARNGETLFVAGENSPVKAYLVTKAGLRWVADSRETSSDLCTMQHGGMPGGMMSLTASDDANGVLWVCMPRTDANMMLSPGRLVVYDAEDFTGGTLKKLWDSADWGWEFTHAKFTPPVVADGRAYLPTYDGETWVLELA